jgi:toxin ParE1/3/4
MLRYLKSWINQLRRQRLRPMKKLTEMLLNRLEGILNCCRTKVPLGVVEAVNGNIKVLLRRGRGYHNLIYLLLKAQRLAATSTNSSLSRKPRRMAALTDSRQEPFIHVAAVASPDFAARYTDAIMEQCESLKTFPMRGALRDDIRPGLRVLGFRRRVSIPFEVTCEVVTILGIFYGGQNFETAFNE